MTTLQTKTISLPLNARWAPCFPDHQYEGRAGDFVATLRRFAVVTDGGSLHGAWKTLDEAERFACSMAMGDRAKAVEVEAYWHVPAFGRVT